MIDPLLELARRLRAGGFEVSTGEVLDGVATMLAVGLDDRSTLRECLRAALVKRDDGGAFDRCFDLVFATTTADAKRSTADRTGSAASAPSTTSLVTADDLSADVLAALLAGDDEALRRLAAQAVDRFAGMDDADGTDKYFLHRVLRAIDLSRMLSAAMQQLRRDGELDDLAMTVERSELARRLDEFRRRLAAEIARRRPAASEVPEIPERTRPEDLDLVTLARHDVAELRRVLQPLIRQLAIRIGRRRKLRAAGRLDARRTVRRSLQSGGVPLEIVTRKRHRQRPDIVLLCDVSGSVAEFAQFTFTMVNALHDEVRRVRTFAFVDGIAEVSDLFERTRFDVPVNRLVERRGVIDNDGHSDYGTVFTRFANHHLDVVERTTTVIVTGDGRGNYRDPGEDAFAAIAARARRVYWLNPEPTAGWGEQDSLIEVYRPHCRAIHEVRTLGQLTAAIGELVD